MNARKLSQRPSQLGPFDTEAVSMELDESDEKERR